MKAFLRRIPGVLPLARKVRSVKRALIDSRRLESYVRDAPEVKIVLGAGHLGDVGWRATEIDTLNLLKRSDWDRYFSQRKIDCLLAEHVWEHLTLEDGTTAAKNCFDFLRPGGYLRVAVPDGLHPDPDYIEYVRVGGSGAGADDHKMLYDYRSFSNLFEQVGFQVNALEYFDEEGQLHAQDWDVAQGTIRRSKRFDRRNQNGELNYTSVILDAVKPA